MGCPPEFWSPDIDEDVAGYLIGCIRHRLYTGRRVITHADVLAATAGHFFYNESVFSSGVHSNWLQLVGRSRRRDELAAAGMRFGTFTDYLDL